ncbi:MAG: glycosyltransferase [Nostoc sp.]
MNTLKSHLPLPLIDISLVTYNSAEWIDNFFRSLLEQSYPTKLINVLLTDNRSTDNTVNLCSLVSKKYSDYFHSFQIFERPNLGFGCGHNFNLLKSDSQYFLVSNVDLEFERDAILEAVTTASTDDKDVASWEFRQKPFEHPKYYNPVTLETYWSSNACILFRRYALEKVRGYEEKIFLYGEDVELSYRLRDNGFRIKYCPSSVCWHYTYEYPNQVKRLQFLGSTVANSYIRLRYGSWKEIAAIPLMYLRYFSDIYLLKLLIYFLAGCLYFLYKEKIVFNNMFFLLSIILIVVSFHHNYYNLVAPFALPYILFWLAFKLPFISFDKYGDFSYGLYIYAFPVQQMLAFLGLHKRGFIVYFLVCILVAIILSILSYKFIEKPALKLKKVRLRFM